MKTQNWFSYYRFNYLLVITLVFFGGMLLVSKKAAPAPGDFLLCMVYALAITLNSFITDRILLPRLLYKKKPLVFIFSVAALLTLTGCLMMPAVYAVSHTYYLVSQKQNTPGNWVLSYFIPLLLALVITTIIQVLKDQRSTRSQLQLLQKENAETELNFLKAQINPHFLFNSLNTVYFQIDKTNAQARNTLLQFTNMLQYQLYECNGNTTPIEKEVHYLQNYIALQKLRQNEGYEVMFETAGDVKGFVFAPLILTCFVENAFKHVSHHVNSINTIRIQLRMEGDCFVFDCYNTTGGLPATEAVAYGGIGLQNAQRRLALLYAGRHELLIDRQPGSFRVLLKVTV
jgi:two-component system, LytTR family, sensor kinase